MFEFLKLGTDLFKSIKKGKVVDLSSKPAQEIQIELKKNSGIVALSLNGCVLSGIPNYLNKHKHSLKILSLKNNKFITLPTKFFQLTNLRYLDLSENGLAELPNSFQTLTNLQELILESNQFTHIPDIIEYLTELTLCNLNKNPLEHPPKFFLVLLKKITISGLEPLPNLMKRFKHHNLACLLMIVIIVMNGMIMTMKKLLLIIHLFPP